MTAPRRQRICKSVAKFSHDAHLSENRMHFFVHCPKAKVTEDHDQRSRCMEAQTVESSHCMLHTRLIRHDLRIGMERWHRILFVRTLRSTSGAIPRKIYSGTVVPKASQIDCGLFNV